MHTTYSFVCGCTGSLWLQGFSLVATREAPSLDAQAAHCDAPLLAEHGLQVTGFSRWGTWAQLPWLLG